MSIASDFGKAWKSDKALISVLFAITLILAIVLAVLIKKDQAMTPEERGHRKQAFTAQVAAQAAEQKRNEAASKEEFHAGVLYQDGEVAYSFIQNMVYVKNESSGLCYGVVEEGAMGIHLVVHEDCNIVKNFLWTPKK